VSVVRRLAAAAAAFIVAGPLLGLGAAAADGETFSPAVAPLVQHATTSPDGSAAFTFVPADLQRDTRDLPIGVFDSGVGGLTVLEAILAADAFDNRTLKPGPDGRPDFAGERFVYLGDQANMPYGNYPRANNEAFLRELILKDAVFLLGRRFWPAAAAAAPALDKPPVKAVVIACNTATAYGLDDIRAAMRAWAIPVPVVGVVEAGARGVLQQADAAAAGGTGAVAVLATIGTCASNAYPKAIQTAFGRAGRRAPEVVQQGFADLAAVIEGDPTVTSRTTAERTIAADLRELMDQRRRSGADRPVGTIVLGCTHFPLVRREIVAELARLRLVEEDGGRPFQALIADGIEVVDPAGLTAKELFRVLAAERLRSSAATAEEPLAPAAPERPDGNGHPHRFFLSVVAESSGGGAAEAPWSERKFHREIGRLDGEDTRVVPLRVDLLPSPTTDMIRSRLPHVWHAMP